MTTSMSSKRQLYISLRLTMLFSADSSPKDIPQVTSAACTESTKSANKFWFKKCEGLDEREVSRRAAEANLNIAPVAALPYQSKIKGRIAASQRAFTSCLQLA